MDGYVQLGPVPEPADEGEGSSVGVTRASGGGGDVAAERRDRACRVDTRNININNHQPQPRLAIQPQAAAAARPIGAPSLPRRFSDTWRSKGAAGAGGATGAAGTPSSRRSIQSNRSIGYTIASNASIEIQPDTMRRVSSVRPHLTNPNLQMLVLHKREGDDPGCTLRQGDGWHRESGCFVDSITLNSPAENCGLLQIGDEILEINKVAASQLRLDEAQYLMFSAKTLALSIRPLLAVLDAHIPTPAVPAGPAAPPMQTTSNVMTSENDRFRAASVDPLRDIPGGGDSNIANSGFSGGGGRGRATAAVERNQHGGTRTDANSTLRTGSTYAPTMPPMCGSGAARTPAAVGTTALSTYANASFFSRQEGQIGPDESLLQHATSRTRDHAAGAGAGAGAGGAHGRCVADPTVPATIPIRVSGGQKATLSGILRVRGVTAVAQPGVDAGQGFIYLLDVDDLRRVRSIVTTSGRWSQNYDIDLFRASSLQLHCCRVLEAGAEVVATFDITVADLKSCAAYGLRKVGEKVAFQTLSSNGVAMQLKLQMQTASRSPARRAVPRNRRGGGRATSSSSGGIGGGPKKMSPAFGVALQQVPATSEGGTPMVLMACITELEKRGLHEPELYLLSGGVSASRRLRACAGTPDSIAFLDQLRRLGSHEISTAVKRFLEQLPEPVFSSELAAALSAPAFRSTLRGMAGTDEAAQAILKKVVLLDQPYKSTVLLLLDHFRRVVANAAFNGCTAAVLAAVFAHLLLAERAIPGVPADEVLMDWHVQIAQTIFMCSRHAWDSAVGKTYGSHMSGDSNTSSMSFLHDKQSPVSLGGVSSGGDGGKDRVAADNARWSKATLGSSLAGDRGILLSSPTSKASQEHHYGSGGHPGDDGGGGSFSGRSSNSNSDSDSGDGVGTDASSGGWKIGEGALQHVTTPAGDGTTTATAAVQNTLQLQLHAATLDVHATDV